MQWTVEQGKIKADGKDQDFATYLWTLQGTGQTISIERKLILQATRLPAIRRLGFGKEAEQALIEARRAIGQAEVLPLVVDGKPCEVPATYRTELAAELRKGQAGTLADFLGL